jgi:hypothetical protein
MTATPVPRPVAWWIHAEDVAQFAAERRHCETRRCHRPQVIVTWRYWRSAEFGKVLVAEHFACAEHGQSFAERHHIEIKPAPARRSSTARPASDGAR